MELYDLERSGNCYKIRLFLSILGRPYTRIPVNMTTGENTTHEFLEMNPNGLVPVLSDGATTLYDSAAILTYLAKSYAEESWYPHDILQQAQIIRWLTFEQSEMRYGLARARAMSLKIPSILAQIGTLEDSQMLGRLALEILNRQLSETQWLAGGSHASISDLACYPYTAMSSEGGISIAPYTHVTRWMIDIQGMHGYIPLPS